MKHQFLAVVERDKESGLYIGIVPGLPGAHTQAVTLDELQKNLEEVITLCMEENASIATDIPEIIGTQLVQVNV